MSRINTNVSSLTAQRGLARSQAQQAHTLQRLSTGLRINRGADDPAGLIASESLRSESSGITQAIDNSSRASNVIATAEGALNEVASLLLNIKSLVVASANQGGVSDDEVKANQLQVDSAIASITRISNTANFAGLKLLNGNLDYLTSGVNTTSIKSLNINQANFGTNSTIPVEVNVLQSAKTAELDFTKSSITSSVTINVTGNKGTAVLTFTSGTKSSAIAYAINRISDSTGVVAAQKGATAASGIAITSTGFGSKNYVSVTVQGSTGTFTVKNTAGATVQRAVGVDAQATINGAVTLGDGLNLQLNTSTLQLQLTLDKTFGIGQTKFAITGGGATFQLGPQVSSNQQINVGIQSVAANALGDYVTGFLSDIQTGGTASLVGKKAQQASDILEKAINQVAVIRGRLGALEKNTLQTNVNSLQVALENTTSSESQIRDADFAAETSALSRAQILTQAGTSVLSTANSAPQQVLSLLRNG